MYLQAALIAITDCIIWLLVVACFDSFTRSNMRDKAWSHDDESRDDECDMNLVVRKQFG